MPSRYGVEAWSAHTTFPNTPDTDKEPQVYHTVKYCTNTGISSIAYIMAKEPEDAINKANYMTIEQITACDKKPDMQGNDNVDANGIIQRGIHTGLRYVNDEVGYVDEDEEYY